MIADSKSTQPSYSLNIIRAKQIESQLPLSERSFRVKMMFNGEQKSTNVLSGGKLQWDEVLTFLSDDDPQQNQELTIKLMMDEEEAGQKHFSMKRIKNQFVDLGKQTIKLVKHERLTAELEISIDFDQHVQTSQTIVPKVSLAPNYELYQEPSGLEYNSTKMVNCFSFMDGDGCGIAQERQFELFPEKFKTKFSDQ